MESTRSNNRIIAILLVAALVLGTILFTSEANAASRGYASISNVSKNSFTTRYYCNTKGTYKAKLYVTDKNGSKKKYITTLTYKLKKGAAKPYVYYGTVNFNKASGKTYYTLFPTKGGHNRSHTIKTK